METMMNLRELPELRTSDLLTTRFAENIRLISDDDRRTCRVNLDKAAVLGNSDRHTTRLVVNTVDGYRQVKCNVQAVSALGIQVQGGGAVPLSAIYNVDIL
jgi:hypothetical protein